MIKLEINTRSLKRREFLTTLMKAKSFESNRIVLKNSPQDMNEERGGSSINGGRERKCKSKVALHFGLRVVYIPLDKRITKMPLKCPRRSEGSIPKHWGIDP